MDFETLWDTHERKVATKMTLKRNLRKTGLITLVGILVLSMGAFATSQLFQKDNVDYAFENDPQVIGEWESVDFVENMDDFKVGSRVYAEDFYLKKLAFLSDGGMLIVSSGANDNYLPSGFTYTKGHILHAADKTDSAYEIRTIGSDHYLFMQWKTGDYTYRFAKPSYYVLKQISTEEVIAKTPQSVRNDDVNLIFESDPLALGKWKTVDFVDSPELFNPEAISNQVGNFLKEVEMLPSGLVATRCAGEGTLATGLFKWTNGKVISPTEQCVESYIIKEINGKTYLFFPWINGDVVFRGDPACFYVLEKE